MGMVIKGPSVLPPHHTLRYNGKEGLVPGSLFRKCGTRQRTTYVKQVHTDYNHGNIYVNKHCYLLRLLANTVHVRASMLLQGKLTGETAPTCAVTMVTITTISIACIISMVTTAPMVIA